MKECESNVNVLIDKNVSLDQTDWFDEDSEIKIFDFDLKVYQWDCTGCGAVNTTVLIDGKVESGGSWCAYRQGHNALYGCFIGDCHSRSYDNKQGVSNV